MDWSRVKTILIAMLLVVDAFLLVFYIGQENNFHREKQAIRADVGNVLASQGIEVETEKIPLDSVSLYPAALLREAVEEKKIAERVLGEVSETVSEGEHAYMGKNGNMLFAQNTFSLTYETEIAVTDVGRALEIAKKLAKSLELSTDLREVKCESGDGGYSVTIPQIFSAIPVFNYEIMVKISGNGNVIAHGKLAGNGKISVRTGKVREPSALLLDFADHMKDSDALPMTVTDIDSGYFADTAVGEALSLTPVWRLSTSFGTKYINAVTGELMSF